MTDGAKQGRAAARRGGLAGGILRWWCEVRVRQQRHRSAPRELTLEETLVLTPKQRLVLVRCGQERFLVGTGQDGAPSIVRLNVGAPADGEESLDWERVARRGQR